MIILNYWNDKHNIALANWQQVYQLPQRIRMDAEVYRGALYYRIKGSNRRFSYRQIKQGLQRKYMGVINEWLPF